MADKFDTLVEMRRSLTASDFRTTLSYYNIPVKKNSILCPFHNDTHYGSCSINRDGKGATCWVCPPQKAGRMGRSISPVDLVMHFEGKEFKDALEYLWGTILGRPLPEYQKKSRQGFPLDAKQLDLIGLCNARGGMIPVVVNCCSRADEVPDDLQKVRTDEDSCNVIRNVKTESIYSLYDSDKETALWILRGKAAETERYYLDLLGDTFDRESEHWKLYSEDREGVLELRKLLHAKVAEVRRIRARLERIAA